MAEESAQQKFQRGISQFNRREFFEAHETWEEIWLPTTEPDRTFLQGIIQVAAGFHHLTRGNLPGGRSLLEAGVKKLELFPRDYRGLQLEDLRAAVRHWIARLAAGKAPGTNQLPQIARLHTP